MQNSEKKQLDRKTALITGGSKGIGFELAKQFAFNGYDLVLVARGKAELDSAARQLTGDYGCRVTGIGLNLSDDQAPFELFRQVKEQGFQIDVLVNSAGGGGFGPLVDCDPQSLSDMLHLNIVSLSILTRLFLPGMIERSNGRILNVASVLAFFAGAPDWAAYLASKQYVLAFSRGLRSELHGTGVSVTTLCPGPAATAFAVDSGVETTRAYRWLPKVSPAAIARVGYHGTMAGQRYVVPGIINKINAFLGELPPRAIAQAVLSFLLKSGGKAEVVR